MPASAMRESDVPSCWLAPEPEPERLPARAFRKAGEWGSADRPPLCLYSTETEEDRERRDFCRREIGKRIDRAIRQLHADPLPGNPRRFYVDGGERPHWVDLSPDSAQICDCDDRFPVCKHEMHCRAKLGQDFGGPDGIAEYALRVSVEALRRSAEYHAALAGNGGGR